MSVVPPGTVADLLGELTGGESNKVVGPGGTPSLGTSPAVDLTALVATLRNAANIVLNSNHYSSYNFGNGATGTANVTFREGDVKFAGNTRGAGILVVTGKLTAVGNFRFDGIVVVLGDCDNSAGTMDIFGAIVHGPSGGLYKMRGSSRVKYSRQAVDLALSLAGRYVVFKGWQEISRS
jgi:hypothetical protein